MLHSYMMKYWVYRTYHLSQGYDTYIINGKMINGYITVLQLSNMNALDENQMNSSESFDQCIQFYWWVK